MSLFFVVFFFWGGGGCLFVCLFCLFVFFGGRGGGVGLFFHSFCRFRFRGPNLACILLKSRIASDFFLFLELTSKQNKCC